MKALFLGFVATGLLFTSFSWANPILKKSFDGQVANCSSRAVGTEDRKLLTLSMSGDVLKVRLVLCRDGRLVQDRTPSVRLYQTFERVTVLEKLSKFTVVFLVESSPALELPLDGFEETGAADIPLDSIQLAPGTPVEIFLTAQKEVSTSSGLRYNDGKAAWGSYLLHR